MVSHVEGVPIFTIWNQYLQQKSDTSMKTLKASECLCQHSTENMFSFSPYFLEN